MSSQETSPSAFTLDGDESELTPLTDSDFSDSEDSDFMLVSRPTKKRRITKVKEKKKKKEVVKPPPKKLRAFRGVLKDIWVLPLDVTYEIFGHLKPLDLLQLSRTSKSLREILMSRSSVSVWMSARANIEALPDCPFDMSEPEYASLVFETHCHYCFANNVQTVIWEARMRCCKRCGGTMYTHWVNLVKEKVPDVLQSIVPSTHEFTTGTVYPHTEKKYSLEQAVVLTVEMARMDEESQALWFWNKKKEYDRIVEHAELCREFLSGRHTRRNRELEDARLKRTNSVIEKLTALGWGEEIEKMSKYRLTEHKHVKIPKDLTERAWQKIEADMIAFMQDVREKRLVKEKNKIMTSRCALMKQMYANFVASQPMHSILPGVADFATMPELRAILENPDLDATVTLEDFDIGAEKMLEFSAKWREEKDKALLDILRQSSLGSMASKEMLSRATTLFNCKTCSVPVSYPRILVHTCNFTRNVEMPDPSNIFERLRAEPWNLGGDRVSFHEAAHKRAKYVLKALSLDPEISVDDMNEANPFVECYCALCYRPGAVRTFARWGRMIEHTPRYTTAHVSRPYGVVDARRTALVKKLEILELSKLRREHDWDDYSHRSYCCMTCKIRDTRHSMEKHITAEHGVVGPRFDTDYTYHIDAKMRLRAPFVNLKIAAKTPKNAEAGSSTAAAATNTTATATTTTPATTTTTTPAVDSAASSSSSSIEVQGDSIATPVVLTPSTSLDGVVSQPSEASGSGDAGSTVVSPPDTPQPEGNPSTVADS
ncbi:hypothetical protein D9611_004188 [Ephemerocybe angulata]|uniref:F-box domain-containing protein n=1 Tax=Ephemerocybe angulata TaxID=980116 RepID=A0A8H5BKA7_9AGAR|nr:hypothetical protein D9611_004188 [Tulosesus angulatus]